MDVKPIIVGVDGSPDSERALQWAANYARRSGAPLHAVTTWELPTVYGPAAMVSWESSESMERQALAVLTDSVRSALGEDAQVAQRTERGHPSEVLVEIAQEAQLLVVGSRGRGGFRGMLLGSVSQHCVTHAPCPVVVLQDDETGKD